MVDYVSRAMKQASHKATVLLLPAWDRSIPGRSSSGADRVFYFEEGAARHTEADCQDMAENEGTEDFGGILMIWPSRKQLVGPRMAHDVVNPRMLE